MKFLVPNYSCLQNPWLGGLTPPRSPFSLCPLSSTEFVEPPPPPEQNSWLHHLYTAVLMCVYTKEPRSGVSGCAYGVLYRAARTIPVLIWRQVQKMKVRWIGGVCPSRCAVFRTVQWKLTKFGIYCTGCYPLNSSCHTEMFLYSLESFTEKGNNRVYNYFIHPCN